jgi:sulfate adenylyltransferase
VGRDHAGVGDYYGTYDAQLIFDEFDADALGIIPIKLEHSFWCKKQAGMATSKTTNSDPSERVFLSGTAVRKMLEAGEMPPVEFTRPEVAQILVEAMKNR